MPRRAARSLSGFIDDHQSDLINGPNVNIVGKNGGGVGAIPVDGPAYSLHVTSVPNAKRHTLASVADSVMHALNDDLTPDDIASPADSAFSAIAGQRVLIVHESCGDCLPTAIYFVTQLDKRVGHCRAAGCGRGLRPNENLSRA